MFMWRLVQAHADAEGHICLELPAHHYHPYQCTKESEPDTVKRVQEATSMLATVQHIFHQVKGSPSCPCVPGLGIVYADATFVTL